jgi:hypothetical protein
LVCFCNCYNQLSFRKNPANQLPLLQAEHEVTMAKKITPPRAAASGSKRPELQFSAPKFAYPPQAITSDNAYLTSDSTYLYEQIPRAPGRSPRPPTLRGLIATLDVETLERRVARFQRTDAAEFAARSAELDAASEQFEPLPLLADISFPTLQSAAAPALEAAEGSVLHRCWRLTAGDRDRFRSILTNSELTIAGSEALWDALLHRHQSRLRSGTAPSGPEVLVLVIAREHGARRLRPVHRVLRNLPGFQGGEMVRVVRENFFFEDVTRAMPRLGGSGPHFEPETAKQLLRPLHPGEVTMLAITAHSSFRLHSEAGWADTVLAHLSPKLRQCASVQLHEIILDRRLGVPYRTRDDGLQQASDHVVYESDMTAAVRAVADGANVAFLMAVPNSAVLLASASRGEWLPARSAELDLHLQGLMKYVVAD